jgi:PilZ domain-containing protein
MSLNLYPSHDARQRPIQRYRRTLFTAPITLHHLRTGGIQTARGVSLDISEGGLGAIVQSDLFIGETVEISFRLRETVFNTVAIVRHTSNVQSGFEFLGLTAEERRDITRAASNC